MASHLLLLTLLAASPILGDSSMTDDVKFGLKNSVYNIVSDHLAGKLPKNDMEALAAYFPKEIQELLPDLSWWLNSEKPYKPKGTLVRENFITNTDPHRTFIESTERVGFLWGLLCGSGRSDRSCSPGGGFQHHRYNPDWRLPTGHEWGSLPRGHTQL